MPMRIFVSAGEPSGDLHGGNLIKALSRIDRSVHFTAFGGERMSAAGARILFPLSRLSIIGFVEPFTKGHRFLEAIWRADRYFREERPDAAVLIDFPGFHWWLARRAGARGIPVYYFVPPQLWAWAGWRVSKMRRSVDQVLCSLPFEEAWYHARGVPARYVGHPYFDELTGQRLDDEFIASQRALPGRMVALLPGSRTQELKRNLTTLLRAAARIHAACPDTRFLVACLSVAHQESVASAIRGRVPSVSVYAEKTPEIIELAHSAIAVSGSVGLELLYRAKPSVVTYRVHRHLLWLSHLLKKCEYISLVNLLAERELFPEFLSAGCEANGIAEHVIRWLKDENAYRELRIELSALRDRVALPGACNRAARWILEDVEKRRRRIDLPAA